MTDALTVVNRFFKSTSAGDIAGAVAQLADDVVFVGPLMRTSGASEYAAILRQFLPTHVETRILKQFEDGEEVCSVTELDVRSPAGETITLALAEWFRLRNGKIAEHRIFYDPREFARTFGMPS